jgi:hypothetical protein
MKVICQVNNINDISDEFTLMRLKKYILMPDGEVDLEVNKEYTVYGVVFWDNSPWYYICVEDYDEYPKPFPAEVFEVSDDRLSPYWKVTHEQKEDGEVQSSLLFNEWSKDTSFYERLIEEDEGVIETFEKYRELMNQQ